MQRIYLAPAFVFLSLLTSSTAVGLASCDAGEVTSGLATDGGTTGCTPMDGASLPPTAPNGYYVNGNSVCTLDGKPHLLHGVDRPSLEWSQVGQNLSAADFQAMGAWHANVVRIALNQDFWLSDSPAHSAAYAPLVDQAVKWAHAAGLDVILDLHWSDIGNYDFAHDAGQQLMADMHSVKFWSEVAAAYKGDGRVFFELYNEPHGIAPDIWLSGGMSGSAPSFEVAGMQQLYDAVRGAGANNLVLVGGLDFAYDLSFVGSSPVKGYNIAYATHPYNNGTERQPGNWDFYWGYLTQKSPVVLTEFGDVQTGCTGAWDQSLITYADHHNAGWTAWGWYPGNCSFPSLISTWNATPTVQGAVVREALLGYDDPAVYPSTDGGSDTTDAATDGPDEAGDAGPDDTGDGGALDAGADADAG